MSSIANAETFIPRMEIPEIRENLAERISFYSMHPITAPALRNIEHDSPTIIEDSGQLLESQSDTLAISEEVQVEMPVVSIGYDQLALNGLSRVKSGIKSISSLAAHSKEKITDSYQLATAQAKGMVGTIVEVAINPEYKKKRRVLGLAIGGLALAAGVYMASKGLNQGSPRVHHVAEYTPAMPQAPARATEVVPSLIPAPKPHVINQIHEHLQPKFHMAKLRFHGDNIWNWFHDHVPAKHGHQSKNSWVNMMTQRAIRSNGFSQWDIHHLPDGARFKY
jgi:hypothetical protein